MFHVCKVSDTEPIYNRLVEYINALCQNCFFQKVRQHGCDYKIIAFFFSPDMYYLFLLRSGFLLHVEGNIPKGFRKALKS